MKATTEGVGRTTWPPPLVPPTLRRPTPCGPTPETMILTCPPPPVDAHVSYVLDAYDIPFERGHTVTLPDGFRPPDGDWNIGVIVGPSGSGKSSLLRTLPWPVATPRFDGRALISNFDTLPPEEAARLLTSVGLGSVPCWLRPYEALSTGEKARAELAQALCGHGVAVVDEFTSTVNREVAASMSHALSKKVRRDGGRVVLATCHYDVLGWLTPDWVFDTKGYRMLDRDRLQRRPEQRIEVFRAKYEAWDFFKDHHYMTDKLNRSARLYMATLNGEAVAICAVLAQPSGHVRNGWRCSRLVTIPDFQGRGFGKALNNYIGSLVTAHGGRYFFKTVNPAIGEYHERSPMWRPTSKNRMVRKDAERYNEFGTRYNGMTALSRVSYCHEYVGPPAAADDPLYSEFA